MNSTELLPRPLSTLHRRRTTLGLGVGSVVLGGSLTACGGSELDKTTCGELKDMSSSEVFDLIKDAAEDDGSDDAKAAAKAFEDVPEDQRDAVAKTFAEQICAGESDDTELQDTDLVN